MLAKIFTAAMNGIDAEIVAVEVDISAGLPGWHLVGLPDTVVRESKDRVAPALRNSGHTIPARKITVNFSPADNRKRGTSFDLPIAVGLLSAIGTLKPARQIGFLFAAELSLTGKLLPIKGMLAMAVAAKKNGLHSLVVPVENFHEASLVNDLDIYGCEDLQDVVSLMAEGKPPTVPEKIIQSGTRSQIGHLDLADVKGQTIAKRALEISAAGGHNILMVGPPGTGKTMLAERLPSILPPLSPEESLETTKIYSALGLLDDGHPLMVERPFRSPHHSASYAGLFGGGSGSPTIGEISLAHNGVLFLDEMPEFRKDVIEVLRQPLESGIVRITRAGYSVKYPARFILAAAMNPCRCGYFGHNKRPCICSVNHIRSYRKKLSGPLLDRIDLRIEVASLSPNEISSEKTAEPSVEIRKRVLAARKMQHVRYKTLKIADNSSLKPRNIKEYCGLDVESKKLMRMTLEARGYSARAYDRIIRVARTIADLDSSKEIRIPHIAEAIQHHRLDRLDEM